MGKGRRTRKTSPAPGEFIILKNMMSSDEETIGKRSVGTTTDIRTKSKGSQTDHVVIQMPGDEDQSLQVPNENEDKGDDSESQNPAGNERKLVFSFSVSYLSTYFDFMQWIGMLHVGKNDRIFSLKSALHLIAFGIIYVMTLTWEIGSGKDYMLSRNSNKKTTVFYFISIWFYLHTVFVSMYFMKLVTQSAVSDFFNNIEIIKEKRTKDETPTRTKISKLAVGIVIINIMVSGYLASGADQIFFNEFDQDDLIVYRAAEFKARLMFWQKDDYNYRFKQAINVTTLETEHIVYGCAEIGLQFAGWLHFTTLKDIVLVSALTLHSHTSELKDFLFTIRNEPITLSVLGLLSFNWEVLHLLSFEIESQFGTLFNMIAVDNWLNGAYTLLFFMQTEFKFDGYFVANIYIMIKSLIAYILAAIARKAAPMLKRRLYINSPPVESTDEMDVAIRKAIGDFERKIDNTSVGMGTGNFHVDENFVYKYIGSVLSSTVVFMDHQKKDAEA